MQFSICQGQSGQATRNAVHYRNSWALKLYDLVPEGKRLRSTTLGQVRRKWSDDWDFTPCVTSPATSRYGHAIAVLLLAMKTRGHGGKQRTAYRLEILLPIANKTDSVFWHNLRITADPERRNKTAATPSTAISREVQMPGARCRAYTWAAHKAEMTTFQGPTKM